MVITYFKIIISIKSFEIKCLPSNFIRGQFTLILDYSYKFKKHQQLNNLLHN